MQNSNSEPEFVKVTGKNIGYQLQNLRQLVFEVTDRCNLNCAYCTYSSLYDKGYDQRNGKNMSFIRAKLMIDYLYRLWKENHSDGACNMLYVSFYGGEPLMNVPLIKQVIEYMENLEKTGRVYSYGMTTNAMLLNQYMDYLAEKNFRLLISLDGDEFSQSYRVDHSGKNSFARVFHNVKLLQEKYPEYFQKRIGFHAVLHNRNDVESICQFIKTNFAKIPQIMPLNNAGVSEEKKEEFKKMYQNPVESFNYSKNCEALESELLMQAPRVSQLVNYIQYQSGNVFNRYSELYINKDDFDFPSTGTCIPFSKKIYVTVNGIILPCERIDHRFSTGRIHDDRVELDEKYVADRHNYYVSKYTKQCINCANNRFCQQCVYQIDDITKETTRCPLFMTKKGLERINQKTFDFLEKHPQYYKRILEEVKIIS
jgi:uncharacterized protein